MLPYHFLFSAVRTINLNFTHVHWLCSDLPSSLLIRLDGVTTGKVVKHIFRGSKLEHKKICGSVFDLVRYVL